jgi:uncharacterized membrane protein HdeD (DUF308 family)
MQPVNVLLLGAIAMACLIAGLFFLRFWQQSRDRFFALFAAAFLVESVNRTALALSATPSDGAPVFYCVRLLGFLLILTAIVDKNSGSSRAAVRHRRRAS